MTNRNTIRRAVRYALVTSAAAAATTAMPVHAQEDALEEIVVTGSRIVRQDYESASPIVTVSEDLFKQTGAATVETVLNSLPQFVPSITNTSNNPSNGGQANVELRGLDTVRTLVLLDGRRLVPANGTGVVDLNMLPASIIQNVEIITGGASAVYGSDAVAGVVNFKTKDFEGLEVETNWGETSESDGEEWQASVTGGMRFADGRGHAMLNLAYADRSAVRQGDRDFSRVALGYDADRGFEPVGSGTIEEGRVTVGPSQAAFEQLFVNQYGAAPAGTAVQNTVGFNSDGTLFTTGTGAANSVLNFRGDTSLDTFNPNNYTYNFAPPNYLQLPLERKSGFGRVTFELSPAAELYGQLIYATYDANTQLAPTPASSLFIPVTNPFVPDDLAFLAASRANPDANLSLVKRVTEIGPRFENNEYEVYQFVGGVRGDITSNWSYDVYGAYGETTIDNTQLGNVSRTKFEELTFSPDGGVAQCGGLNPFGLGSISPECAAYVSVDALNTYEIKQTIFEGTITGNLFDLPAGPVGTAFGVFYKEDEYAFVADEALRARTPDDRPDIAGFNASDNTFGKTDSTEFFAEILVPIVRDVPGIQALDLTAGYRYADYSTAGGVNSYKGELSWAPVNSLRVRGSYQRAVRAPNIVELFQPQITNFPSIEPGDPCNISSSERTGSSAAAVRDLCLAQGLPSSLIDSYNNPNDQAEGLSGGNPDLFEETADTYSIGFVFQSPSSGIFADFQASIDYYDISIEDAIDVVTAETFVSRCYDPAFNPGLSTDNFYCNFFARNTSTGEITDALELVSNIGAIETSGIDLQLDWRFDAGPGQLSFNWIATYLDKFERQELPGDVFEPYEGTVGTNVANAFPEWKWAFNVGYNWGGLGMNARWRYIDGMTDKTFDGSSADFPKFSIPSVSYYDLTAYYSFTGGFADGLTLRAGVVNLTDEEPEIYPSSIQANTDPSTYDVLGRRYFINVNYAF